ncbi:MAG: response regulator [Myxococcales bacterium]|nr:response regulator [Myxococcales bacterium]
MADEPPRVLVVEDDELVRRGVARALRIAGYHVESVGCGSDALALAREGARFDVLLTDLTMPDMSGIDVAKQLAELGCARSVLIMSGHLPPEVDLDSANAAGWLCKPFVVGTLVARINEALAHAEGS